MLGLSVSKDDVDLTEMEKFSLGTNRTFEQWKTFSGIDPSAPFLEGGKDGEQFNTCHDLSLVPLNE